MMNIVQDGDIPHDPSEISDSDSLDNEIEENRNITLTKIMHTAQTLTFLEVPLKWRIKCRRQFKKRIQRESLAFQ